jgi:hypothetical protein
MFGLKLASRLIATKVIEKPNIYVRFLCFLKERERDLSRLIDPAHLSLGKVGLEREKPDNLSGFQERVMEQNQTLECSQRPRRWSRAG